MPIYEYICQDCDNEFEELLPITSRKNPPCPRCHSNKTERKMSVFGSTGSAKGSGSSCNSSKFT